VPISGLIFRPYQPSDFDALLAMDQACFPKTIAYGRREMKSYLQSEGSRCIIAEILGAEVPRSELSGTENSGFETSKTIAGFILTESNGELAHIITLDVLEAYRRQSIGSLLLEAAEQEAANHGVTHMYLETATMNKAAIALWKKHGYRGTGTIENYYGRGQNAFEMQKRLERKSQVKVHP
jgi:[ribosomal protein S18]-alanine N-acetyltransferase